MAALESTSGTAGFVEPADYIDLKIQSLRDQLAAAQARIKQLESALDQEMVITHLGVFNPGDDPVKAIKELMLWSQGVGEYFAKEQTQAREDELVAEIERKMSAADFIIRQNNELSAYVERLREALERMRVAGGSQEFHMAWELAKDLLAATPAQSLARLRNEVLEEVAKVCDRFAEREMHPAECAGAIRSMKEPE